jgi:hypothetical protein
MEIKNKLKEIRALERYNGKKRVSKIMPVSNVILDVLCEKESNSFLINIS